MQTVRDFSFRVVCVLPELEPRTLCMPQKHWTAELHRVKRSFLKQKFRNTFCHGKFFCLLSFNFRWCLLFVELQLSKSSEFCRRRWSLIPLLTGSSFLKILPFLQMIWEMLIQGGAPLAAVSPSFLRFLCLLRGPSLSKQWHQSKRRPGASLPKEKKSHTIALIRAGASGSLKTAGGKESRAKKRQDADVHQTGKKCNPQDGLLWVSAWLSPALSVQLPEDRARRGLWSVLHGVGP